MKPRREASSWMLRGALWTSMLAASKQKSGGITTALTCIGLPDEDSNLEPSG
jgi:hypothetical protein